MDIGEKLKTVRTNQNLTQEELADLLGVSRQTISNWENCKSYPDIIQIIKMSDIYQISLDELLKGDSKMVAHLEESTNIVKSRQRFIKYLILFGYLLIWVSMIVWFWCGGAKSSPFGYGIIVLCIVLPITTLICSFLIGIGRGWSKWKWVLPLLFGGTQMLTQTLTFTVANVISTGNLHFSLDIYFGSFGLGISFLGMGLGHLVHIIKQKYFSMKCE